MLQQYSLLVVAVVQSTVCPSTVQSTRARGEREPRRARAAPRRERGGPHREHGEARADPTANEGRPQGGKRRQARRASLEEVEGSMSGLADAKALQDDQQNPGPTPSLAKPETGKEVGRRKARPQDKRVK